MTLEDDRYCLYFIDSEKMRDSFLLSSVTFKQDIFIFIFIVYTRGGGN